MKTNHLPQADLLDILFEHRNKSYGAYALRRQYPAHLFKALCMGLSIAGAIIFFMTHNRKDQLLSVPFIPLADTIKMATVRPPEKTLPPPELPPAQALPQNSIKDIVPVIVPDDISIEDSVPSVEQKEQNLIGRVTQQVEAGSLEVNKGNEHSAPDATATSEPSSPEIYDFNSVQEPASFPGGHKALSRFMENNLQNPRNGDAEPGETVKVQVKFVVGKDGQPEGFTVIGSGGELFDQEVLRVLRKMPRWKPARRHNQLVAMFFIMPVRFAVNGDE